MAVQNDDSRELIYLADPPRKVLYASVFTKKVAFMAEVLLKFDGFVFLGSLFFSCILHSEKKYSADSSFYFYTYFILSKMMYSFYIDYMANQYHMITKIASQIQEKYGPDAYNNVRNITRSDNVFVSYIEKLISIQYGSSWYPTIYRIVAFLTFVCSYINAHDSYKNFATIVESYQKHIYVSEVYFLFLPLFFFVSLYLMEKLFACETDETYYNQNNFRNIIESKPLGIFSDLPLPLVLIFLSGYSMYFGSLFLKKLIFL